MFSRHFKAKQTNFTCFTAVPNKYISTVINAFLLKKKNIDDGIIKLSTYKVITSIYLLGVKLITGKTLITLFLLIRTIIKKNQIIILTFDC